MALVLDGNGTMTVGNGDITGITRGAIESTAIGAGAVLQVVQSNYSTTVTVSTNTYTDTGLSASITPTSATSKILVLIQQSYYTAVSSGGTGGGVKLLRGSTDIYNPMPTDGVGPYGFYVSATGLYLMAILQYLDSPATTSNITYKTQGRPYSSGAGQSTTFQVGGSTQNAGSSMILMEIAG
jgi:hypothetical protein